MSIITATITGEWITYPRYNIPGIVYNDKLLFTIYDNNLKFILVNKSYDIIKIKYSNKKINIKDSELIISEFENSKNIVPTDYCHIFNFQEFNEFPPNDCLKNKILFTIWFGKSYTKNRDKQFKSILENSKCNVLNINENNLHLLKYPIHKSFIYLSSIHKSDYLRCYLMYYYGGGYSDLKGTSGSWIDCFNDLERNNNLYAIGYPCDGLPSKADAGEDYSLEIRTNLELNIKKIIGVGFFIYKKDTNLVKEWFQELNTRLDKFYENLKKHPARFDRESKCGAPIPRWEGGNLKTNYPIYWNYILGHILYPIQIRYLKYIKLGIPHITNSKDYK
jgi:hypothetical protein